MASLVPIPLSSQNREIHLIRSDFDTHFNRLVKALGVKMTTGQATYFFDHYRLNVSSDFSAACEYLGRGNPGFVPKQAIFDNAVMSAQEMRLQAVKTQREVETREFYQNSTAIANSPLSDLWVTCIRKVILKVILSENNGEEREAREFVESALEDPMFQHYDKGRLRDYLDQPKKANTFGQPMPGG